MDKRNKKEKNASCIQKRTPSVVFIHSLLTLVMRSCTIIASIGKVERFILYTHGTRMNSILTYIFHHRSVLLNRFVSGDMRTYVISIDNHKLESFYSNNTHLIDVSLFMGTIGRDVDESVREQDGSVLAHPMKISSQDYGAASSHLRLLKHICNTHKNDEVALVLEDDVHTHPKIQSYNMTPSSSLTLCSYNLNSFLVTDVAGIRTLRFFSPEHPTDVEFRRMKTIDIKRVQTEKLIGAWGAMCYFIRPQLACELSRSLRLGFNRIWDEWPIHPALQFASPQFEKLHRFGFDAALNSFYSQGTSYVTHPPLGLTTNIRN